MISNMRESPTYAKVEYEAGVKSTQRMVKPLQESQASDSLICICAWCKKVRIDDHLWVDIIVPGEDNRVTHGICPECARCVRLEINGPYWNQ
jgi:hypothetical protein